VCVNHLMESFGGCCCCIVSLGQDIMEISLSYLKVVEGEI
jgi:hypothetical protein